MSAEAAAWTTPDLSDAYPDTARCVIADFRAYGKVQKFSGRVQTVRCPDDNSLVRKALSSPVAGDVLVVDAAGLRTHSMLGDQLALLAVENGWSGLVINGVVRDVEVLRETELGVMALGVIPRKTEKRGDGQRNVRVHFGHTYINSGDWIYADASGVLVLPRPIPNMPLK